MSYGFFSINKHGHLAMSSEHPSIVLYATIPGDPLINTGPAIDMAVNKVKFVTRTLFVGTENASKIFIPFLRYPQNSAGTIIGQYMTRSSGNSAIDTLSITLAYTGKVPHIYIFSENTIFKYPALNYGLLIKNEAGGILYDSGRKNLNIHGEGIITIPPTAQLQNGIQNDNIIVPDIVGFNKKESPTLRAYRSMSALGQVSVNAAAVPTNTYSSLMSQGRNLQSIAASPMAYVSNTNMKIGLCTLNALYPSFYLNNKITNVRSLYASDSPINYLYYAPIKRATVASSYGYYENSSSSWGGLAKTKTVASAALARSYYALMMPSSPSNMVTFYCMDKEDQKYEEKTSSGFNMFLGIISLGILGGIFKNIHASVISASVQAKDTGFLSTNVVVAKVSDYE